MYARCMSSTTVDACNIRTLAGHKARKDQQIYQGEILPIVRQYTSTSLVFHGDLIYVLAREGYHLHVHAKNFETRERL